MMSSHEQNILELDKTSINKFKKSFFSILLKMAQWLRYLKTASIFTFLSYYRTFYWKIPFPLNTLDIFSTVKTCYDFFHKSLEWATLHTLKHHLYSECLIFPPGSSVSIINHPIVIACISAIVNITLSNMYVIKRVHLLTWDRVC